MYLFKHYMVPEPRQHSIYHHMHILLLDPLLISMFTCMSMWTVRCYVDSINTRPSTPERLLLVETRVFECIMTGSAGRGLC